MKKKTTKIETKISKDKIQNPWNQEQTKKPVGFGLLNDIMEKYYGKDDRKDDALQDINDSLQALKQQYEERLALEKQAVYIKYRQHFEISRKIVQIDNIVSFVQAIQNSQIDKAVEAPINTAYIRVPFEAQPTFTKLFNRVVRNQTVEIEPTTVHKHIEALKEARKQLFDRLHLQF